MQNPRPKRGRTACPLCGHPTWTTKLKKHQSSLDCEVGQTRLALYRRGLEPASRHVQSLKAAGVPMEQHVTDYTASTHFEYVKNGPSKKKRIVEKHERWWAPRWALAVCWSYDLQKPHAFRMKKNKTQLHQELREMMALPVETQEAFIIETRLFRKVRLWHEAEGQAAGQETAP